MHPVRPAVYLRASDESYCLHNQSVRGRKSFRTGMRNYVTAGVRKVGRFYYRAPRESLRCSTTRVRPHRNSSKFVRQEIKKKTVKLGA